MLRIEAYSDTILTHIDFSLRKGENLVILGSNGAGKSTLAKVLCGVIPSKSVLLEGIEANRLSTKEKTQCINYVPAKLEIFDGYISTREYLELSRLYGGKSVDEVMALMGIEALAEKSCKSLSSGEQQLTLLASALLHNAQLTIFDEPTANLDPQKTRKVYELLKSDLFQNKIVITHDLNLAAKLGYKVLYMQEGKVHFFGENEAFFEVSNLTSIFNDSVKKIGDVYVVNL